MKISEMTSSSPEQTKGKPMTKDPICGMTVDEATAPRAEREGQTFYFCSEHCRKKFLAQPSPAKADGESCHGDAKHTQQKHAAHNHEPDHGAEEHACHSHAHAAVKPSAAAKYFCPMCSGVESEQPGDCPKCGMALEPMSPTAGADDEENTELRDMTRRFWIGAALTLPVFVLAMAHLIPGARS